MELRRLRLHLWLALPIAFAPLTATAEPADLVLFAGGGYTQLVTRQSPFPARTQPGGTLGLTLGVEGARHALGLSASLLTVGQSRLDDGFAYRPYGGARYGVSVLRRLAPPAGQAPPASRPLNLSAGAELSLVMVRLRDSTLYAAAPGAALLARLDLDRPQTPWVWFGAVSIGADWRRDLDLSAGATLTLGIGYNLSRALRPWIESLEPPDRRERGAPRGYRDER